MRFLIALFLVIGPPAFAQLKWEQEAQFFASKPLDKQVVANYRFTNEGNSFVLITEVRTSCGCTTAALAKREYLPGESGVIEAKFEFAGHIGHQEKWIYVTTNLAPQDPTLLRLVVDIPQAVKIEPELLVWRLGDQLAAKSFRIVIMDDFPAKIVSVQPNDPVLHVAVREIRPGKEAEVQVSPPTTGRRLNATLLIQTDYPPAHPETQYVFVRVK